ncbi:chitin synthase III catalytic subunit [Myxozyma melibiosi]|uniref:Chitin synthase III catalytic subunit n=1 Tax=Myxozyma melibiosi TaxID=54550 RepID=A0ABR1EZQ5_9ASCO
MSSNYGNFDSFCRYSNLPACNLFDYDYQQHCALRGFTTAGNGRIENLGLMLISFFACITCLLFIYTAQRRTAAVGRREMQILFFSYLILSISAIFASGGFIFNRTILVYFSAIEIGATAATAWLLVVNAIVAYQILPDGGFLSVSLTFLSGLAFFIGVGYIALDSAFNWTNTFDSAPSRPELMRNYALYTTYLLWPILAISLYLILQFNLVVRVLRERKPLLLLFPAFILFVIGQIFEFVISRYICSGTTGHIDGSMFACLFTLFSFGGLWAFWTDITEDHWIDPAVEWVRPDPLPNMREVIPLSNANFSSSFVHSVPRNV